MFEIIMRGRRMGILTLRIFDSPRYHAKERTKRRNFLLLSRVKMFFNSCVVDGIVMVFEWNVLKHVEAQVQFYLPLEVSCPVLIIGAFPFVLFSLTVMNCRSFESLSTRVIALVTLHIAKVSTTRHANITHTKVRRTEQMNASLDSVFLTFTKHLSQLGPSSHTNDSYP